MDLLYRMTKSHNVEVIVEKMVEFLEAATDAHTREETVGRIGDSRSCAPNTRWFIDTMNTLFAIGGDVVKPALAHDLIRLFGEGGDAAADAATRATAARACLDLVKTPKLSRPLLEVIIWVLGEYGPLSGETAANLGRAVRRGGDAAERGGGRDAGARDVGWANWRRRTGAPVREERGGSREWRTVAAWTSSRERTRSSRCCARARPRSPRRCRETPAPRSWTWTALPELEALVADAVSRRLGVPHPGGARAPRAPKRRRRTLPPLGRARARSGPRRRRRRESQVRRVRGASGPGGRSRPSLLLSGRRCTSGGRMGPAAARGRGCGGVARGRRRARLAGALGGGSAAAAAAAPPRHASASASASAASDMDLLMGLDAPGARGGDSASGTAPDLLGGLEQLSVGGAPAACPGSRPRLGRGRRSTCGWVRAAAAGPGVGRAGAAAARRDAGASTIPTHLRDGPR